MKAVQLKAVTPHGYKALTLETVCEYLAGHQPVTERLGARPSDWTAQEVGDGNLNLVFIVQGSKSAVVVKQALPYVRLVGESWPLPLDRAHYEYKALVEQSRHAAALVPALYHHDHDMALTVMEYLSPHIILRKGLIQNIQYPKMAADIGIFLARTLFSTSDYALSPAQKRDKMAQYLTNTAMCKISEDLIFDEPYFDAPMNRHTTPQLDDIALQFRQDVELKLAVQALKSTFMNNAQALLHGDLHTGSVMVTESNTRVIDPEFAFFGPMGFDVGAFLANLFMAYFSKERGAYASWVLDQAQTVWDSFAAEFSTLWNNRSGGEICKASLYADTPALEVAALRAVLDDIFQEAIGFAGCKIIRRILELAHVEDFESIQDQDRRAARERAALAFARRLIIERKTFKTMADVLKAAA